MRMRAFSLIEVMVVVAILGVLVALAAPSLLDEVRKTKLNFAGDQMASFLARAQAEALVTRRCVRVRAAGAQELVAERLNVFDCDNDPASATRISAAGAPLFIEFARLRLESPKLSITFDGTAGSVVPNECNPAPGGAGPEVRFRPNGRVFSSDGSLANDDAVLVVTHNDLASANTHKVLVNGHGLICVLQRGVDPPGGPDFNCP